MVLVVPGVMLGVLCVTPVLLVPVGDCVVAVPVVPVVFVPVVPVVEFCAGTLPLAPVDPVAPAVPVCAVAHAAAASNNTPVMPTRFIVSPLFKADSIERCADFASLVSMNAMRRCLPVMPGRATGRAKRETGLA